MINYNNKFFKAVRTSLNGETSADTVFHYKQSGNILTAEYSGGKIAAGHLIGLVNGQGHIDMHYHQINDEGELMIGVCHSVPEVLSNGKIIQYVKWQRTSDDMNSEDSNLVEV